MQKIHELIEKLCPNGVKFEKIENLTNFEQPTKYIVKSTKYNEKYAIPVLTAGQSFILGYTNEQNGIYNASKEKPVIIFDDFTGAFKWVDFPFKVKSSAIKIITAKNNKTIIRYLYHMMGFLKFCSNEHKRLWISAYSQFKVAVPPLEVQCEIVHILDDFTLLSAELSAELKARRKQYEYYKKTLFENKNIELKTLKELATNCDNKRKPITSGNREKGEYPYYGASGIVDYVKGYIFDGDYLLISEDGANLVARKTPIAFSISGKNWVNNHAHVLKFSNMYLQKYVEMYLNYINIEQYISGAAQPKLNQVNLNKIVIPIPNNDTLKNIVDILLKFDKITNDISEGLPAEIEARQKQYEYYRDKLLTFKELKVNE